ncbi:tRNA(m(1)G37)methyltransferase [Entophlyctis luteolus]|nr:tRNA(m(1)G37)methyltransferase [Entophlyctis luteolus]
MSGEINYQTYDDGSDIDPAYASSESGDDTDDFDGDAVLAEFLSGRHSRGTRPARGVSGVSAAKGKTRIGDAGAMLGGAPVGIVAPLTNKRRRMSLGARVSNLSPIRLWGSRGDTKLDGLPTESRIRGSGEVDAAAANLPRYFPTDVADPESSQLKARTLLPPLTPTSAPSPFSNISPATPLDEIPPETKLRSISAMSATSGQQAEFFSGIGSLDEFINSESGPSTTRMGISTSQTSLSLLLNTQVRASKSLPSKNSAPGFRLFLTAPDESPTEQTVTEEDIAAEFVDAVRAGSLHSGSEPNITEAKQEAGDTIDIHDANAGSTGFGQDSKKMKKPSFEFRKKEVFSQLSLIFGVCLLGIVLNDYVSLLVNEVSPVTGQWLISLLKEMASTVAAALAPPANKGLASLAETAVFSRSLRLVALRVPQAACSRALQALPPHLLDIPRLRSIISDPCSDPAAPTKLVLLNHSISSRETLPQAVSTFATANNAEIVENHELVLDFNYWTADQLIRSVLPDRLNVPSSFELIGHIAHMNLRNEYLPYKNIVGEIILKKNNYVRTVVNKTDSIDHTFRFFKMELLAGDNDMIAEHKESSCKFKFDFSRVYWHSCLQTEHERLVAMFKHGEAVCDVMAGVGPFALPAAKNRGCLVFANDLNPESFKWLGENIALNKLSHLVRPYNMDGRDFIWKSLDDLNTPDVVAEMESKTPRPFKKGGKKGSEKVGKESLAQSSNSVQAGSETQGSSNLEPGQQTNFRIFNHYVMNLPATALEFLDAFRGLFHGREKVVPPAKLPIVHCHCFSTALGDLKGDVLRRAERYIGCAIPQENIMAIHLVRDVAPKKEMLCISFRLPAEAAYAKRINETAAEKRKIEQVE